MSAPVPSSPPSPSNAPAERKGLLRRLAPWALGLAAVAGGYTAGVGHWLPDWLRPRVEAAATEALGTPVRLAALRIHPWSLAVEAEGLSVGPATGPWFKLQRAETQLSVQSVWRLAPVLRHVRLVQPELLLERQSAERFNISDVMARLSQPAPEPQPETGPARFAVFNIEVSDGVLRYEDRVLAQSHRIDQLRLNVPFVSSLPAHVDVTVQPLLQARIDGSPLRLEGQTLPFQDGLRSEVAVRWQDVDLAHWLGAAKALLPPAMQPDARAGRLDTDLRIVFEQRAAPALPVLAVRGRLEVQRLDVGLPPAPGVGRADAAWETLRIDGIDAEPLARRVAVASVALDGLSVRLRPVAGAPAAPAAPAPAPAGNAAAAPWQWSVAKLHVGVREVDAQTQADAAWPRLTQLLLDVQGLDARAQAPDARWTLKLLDEHGGQFDAQGTAHPAQQRAEVDVSLAQWPVAPWLQPVQRQLALPVTVSKGRLDAKAHISANLSTNPSAKRPATEAVASSVASVAVASSAASSVSVPSTSAAPQGITLSGAQVTLSDFRADARGRKDRIALKALSVEGIEARASMAPQDAGLRSLAIATVTLDRLDADLLRDAQGLVLGQTPAASAEASQADKAGKADKAPANASAPLAPITLGEFRCQACAVQFTDQAVSPAGVFSLQRTDLSVKGLGSRLDQPLAIVLQTLAQGQGTVRFKGEVRPQPLSVKGALAVVQLDLRALQPYLDPHLNVALASAAVQAEGRIALSDEPKQGLSARYQGKLGLSELRLRDRVNDALFLRWSSLLLDGADLSYANGGIDADLGFIALKDFYGRIIVNPDGRLNLASVVKRADQANQADQSITTPQAAVPGASAPAVARAPGGVTVTSATLPPASTGTATAAVNTPPPPAPQLRWQGVRLAQGEVDFTDTFIKPNYSARLTRIAGDISAVSSRSTEPATVEVGAAVDDGAPLRISGKLNPLGAKLYTDIAGTAKGIELTRLTPYAARYAGYAIEKGTLSVTVRYKVDGGQLEADNQVFLDQLTFGERVDSPDATGLPVLLAVSLLKNARGEIDINLPVSGSLDDPQFSVGGIIWKVVVNLISKAITAPFALLTGGSSSELGVVPFTPGSAELGPAARERLEALVTKLKDRPSIKLEGTGWADPDIDTEGLRQAHVERLMHRAKAKSTGQELSEVVIGPAERSTWLKAAYKAADIQKPRNLVGLAQSLPDDQMTALLKASAPVGRDVLAGLADERANAVKAHLADKLDAGRVRLTASRVAAEGRADAKSGGASVQFSLN